MYKFFKKNKSFFELASRIYVWALLSVYGSGKIMGGQFYQDGKIPEDIAQTPLAEVGSFDLAWTFFGYSDLYILFIGGSQLLGAFLLLFEKTKLLGAAILLPILVNIIVTDYCFSISTGAMMSAIFYFTALCFMLYCNREQVRKAFLEMIDFQPFKGSFWQKMKRVGIAVLIVSVVFFIEMKMLDIVGR